MKKVILVLLVLALCVTMICPVLAAESDFTPSVTYKPVPELTGQADDIGQIVGFTETDKEETGKLYLINGELYVIAEGVHDGVEHDQPCLLITPLAEVVDSTEIPEESRERLQWIYAQILEQGMDFFSDCEGLLEDLKALLGEDATLDDLVVKDLFDVSVLCDPLEAYLNPQGTTVCLDFKTDIAPGTYVTLVSYKGGKWNMIERVEVAEDGSVTCDTFENFCPVAILVEKAAVETVATTVVEDTTVEGGGNLTVWVAAAGASLLAIILAAVAASKKKKAAEKV